MGFFGVWFSSDKENNEKWAFLCGGLGEKSLKSKYFSQQKGAEVLLEHELVLYVAVNKALAMGLLLPAVALILYHAPWDRQ